MRQNIRDQVLEAIELEWFDRDHLILCFVKWMSEDDLVNMLRANEMELPSWAAARYEMDDKETDETL